MCGASARRRQEFHAACLARRRHFPDAMLATATHDHKRGEDVRARLAVLSEIPDEWERAVRRWFELNAPHRRRWRWSDAVAGRRGDAVPDDRRCVACRYDRFAGLHRPAGRVAAQGAARGEADDTSWDAPNLDYEDAARSFLYAIMADGDGFVAEAAAFARRIGPAGAVNGLAQTLLKLTVPGVPDFYQGTEFWDQSLVDPDNRARDIRRGLDSASTKCRTNVRARSRNRERRRRHCVG